VASVEARSIRVVVVEDHQHVRRSVVAVVETAGDIVVCSEAGAMPEADQVAAASEPESDPRSPSLVPFLRRPLRRALAGLLPGWTREKGSCWT
jgi:CheY-like chemotaxis protein